MRVWLHKSLDFLYRMSRTCIYYKIGDRKTKRINIGSKKSGIFMTLINQRCPAISLLSLRWKLPFWPPAQNSGLLRKYSSMTFNVLAFITIHVYLSLEKNMSKIKQLSRGSFWNSVELTRIDPRACYRSLLWGICSCKYFGPYNLETKCHYLLFLWYKSLLSADVCKSVL